MKKLIILSLLLSVRLAYAEEKRLSLSIDVPEYKQSNKHNSLNYNSRVRIFSSYTTRHPIGKDHLELLTLPEHTKSVLTILFLNRLMRHTVNKTWLFINW